MSHKVVSLFQIEKIVNPDGTPTLSFLQKWQHLIDPPTYSVAELPSDDPAEGDIAYATDLRVFNGAGTQEGAGLGTGGLVTYNGTAWKIAGTNVTAVA